jgi:hypothetical protein
VANWEVLLRTSGKTVVLGAGHARAITELSMGGATAGEKHASRDLEHGAVRLLIECLQADGVRAEVAEAGSAIRDGGKGWACTSGGGMNASTVVT